MSSEQEVQNEQNERNESHKPVAIYSRVSTEDQSIFRQNKACHNYVSDRLDYSLAEVKTYSDQSTGTNTDRDGFQELMEAVEDEKHEVVVVKSVSRISRSIRDLDQIVERLVEENAMELHIISEGFKIRPDDDDPFQSAMLQLLGVFAELEAELTKQRAKEGIQARQEADEEYNHGPAPLGFESVGGKLYPTDDYDRICTVLELVQEREMSKRQASRELGCTRKTITNAITERPELYELVDEGYQSSI